MKKNEFNIITSGGSSMKLFRVFFALAIMATGATLAQAADITSPSDTVMGIPNNGRWPGGELPQYAIDDNPNTKYLHFDHSTTDPSRTIGLRIAPAKKGKVVAGLTFTSANDSAGRDPRNFVLKGTNDPAGLNAEDDQWVTIATGTITDFVQSAEWPRLTKTATPICFFNTTPYDYYEIKFPNLRDDGAGMMQVAEIELLERPATGWAPTVNAGVDRMVRIPNLTIELNPTVSDCDSSQFNVVWSQKSGPGTVDFSGTQNSANATVTFPAIDGLYELNAQAFDESGNDANDIVIVRVWDPAKDQLLAHWKLNEGSGLTANDSTAYNDRGTIGHYVAEGTNYPDPNWVAGWIPADGAGNFALDMLSLNYIEVIPDANDLVSAALSPEWGMAISAWIKPVDWINPDGSNANRRIVQKGANDNQYRLLAQGGVLNFHLANVGSVTCPLPQTGLWHHVVASYDGSNLALFVDGLEAASIAAIGKIGVTADPLYIGTKGKTVSVAGDYFKGTIEDVRIYNHPLDLAAVRALTVTGENAPPYVIEIVQPADLALSARNYIDMEATVFDANDDMLEFAWTASDASVTFDDATAQNPRAFFGADGTYTLRLSIHDGSYGTDGSIFKEVTVNVISPTCADVAADGKLLAADLNKDCYINLEDFAILAANWLNCNDPLDRDCDNPYAHLAQP